MATVPVSGAMSPARTRRSVLLPHPLGPMSATTSRGATSSDRCSSAVVVRAPRNVSETSSTRMPAPGPGTWTHRRRVRRRRARARRTADRVRALRSWHLRRTSRTTGQDGEPGRVRGTDRPSPIAFFHPDCTVGSGRRGSRLALGSAASWTMSVAPLVGSSRVAGPYHRSGIAPCPEGSARNVPPPASEFDDRACPGPAGYAPGPAPPARASPARAPGRATGTPRTGRRTPARTDGSGSIRRSTTVIATTAASRSGWRPVPAAARIAAPRTAVLSIAGIATGTPRTSALIRAQVSSWLGRPASRSSRNAARRPRRAAPRRGAARTRPPRGRPGRAPPARARGSGRRTHRAPARRTRAPAHRRGRAGTRARSRPPGPQPRPPRARRCSSRPR